MMKSMLTRLGKGLLKQAEGAPPANREIFVSYAKLAHKGSDIGTFVPAIYELAQAGKLPKKYQKNGKTAFEQAMLPFNSSKAVVGYLQVFFQDLHDQGIPVPYHVPKLRLEQDYLKGNPDVSVRHGSTSLMNVHINIKNKAEKMKASEKLLHYFADWTGLLLTLSMAIAAGAAMQSFVGFLLVGAATYFVQRANQAFDMFDLAEAIYRDASWLFTRDLSLGSRAKLDMKKSVKSILYFLGIAAFGAFAVSNAWAGVFALPVWPLVASVTPMAATTLSYGTALLFSTVTALGSLVAIFPYHYFAGFGFWNNQIDFTGVDFDSLADAKGDKEARQVQKIEESILQLNKEATLPQNVAIAGRMYVNAVEQYRKEKQTSEKNTSRSGKPAVPKT